MTKYEKALEEVSSYITVDKKREKPKLRRRCRIKRAADPPEMSVQLRKKKSSTLSVSSNSSNGNDAEPNSFLNRAPSRRRLILSKFFDKDGRKLKEELEQSGILLKEAVFGNDLISVATTTDKSFREGTVELPEFVVRSVNRIENEFIKKEGLYRMNGSDTMVQKIRLDVDQNDYRTFEDCNEFSVITSALKLYFRELPEMLISASRKPDFFTAIEEYREYSLEEKDDQKVLQKLKSAVDSLDDRSHALLHYAIRHLSKVASFSDFNKMNAKNLATVFGPNFFHSTTSMKRRPESLICENELCNYICEQLIKSYDVIFS